MKQFNLNAWYTGALLALLALCSACVTPATSAEEYFAIGMAYFDMGKYAEAEQWLNRAALIDKTKTASEYNLGRIAFENKRYPDALRLFERVLVKDPKNVMALKATAYTHTKLGNLDKAESVYRQVLTLVPESADDGYNHALLLYNMEKYAESEAVLACYPHALLENSDTILLCAQAQKAQHKPEAVNMYERYLEMKSDPIVRYEFAVILEEGGFFARALEEYRAALKDLPDKSENPSKVGLRFSIARLLLIADSGSEEGISEIEAAVKDGFKDSAEVEKLLEERAISDARKADIRRIIDSMNKVPEQAETEETQETQTSDGEEAAKT
ncbi:MAG: tetratricopeptide repeat protein [Treponema sp.]|jgi:tetratricopeptide (TPR) repeat protein|nr:tetratricopeptide repeat protein [Treponema sp.]